MSFQEGVRKYLSARKPDGRYASFDYCFNHFQSFRDAGNPSDLAAPENLEVSCLHLGFYLASWGMLRGSAQLLQKSAQHLSKVIEAISHADEALWEIDAHCYTERNIRHLLEFRTRLLAHWPSMSDVLFTKVLLGVFGSVPAFDANFKKGFRVSAFGPETLRKIAEFYSAHRAAVDKYRVATFDFVTGKPTGRIYTRAKVIDMGFFIEGMSLNRTLSH